VGNPAEETYRCPSVALILDTPEGTSRKKPCEKNLTYPHLYGRIRQLWALWLNGHSRYSSKGMKEKLWRCALKFLRGDFRAIPSDPEELNESPATGVYNAIRV